MDGCRRESHGWLVGAMLAVTLLAAACTSVGLAAGGSRPSSTGSGASGADSAGGGTAGAGSFASPPAAAAAVGQSAPAGTSAALLARGQQAPATEIPWNEVGRNWFLALWEGSSADGAPVSLFLVNPVGGRYLVHTWPGQADVSLDDWSGDGRRALLTGTGTAEVMDLLTGATQPVAGSPNIWGAGFTALKATNLVLELALGASGARAN